MAREQPLREGDRASWDVGRGKSRRTFTGDVFEVNPSIAPGAKYGIRIGEETYYPLARVRRSR